MPQLEHDLDALLCKFASTFARDQVPRKWVGEVKKKGIQRLRDWKDCTTSRDKEAESTHFTAGGKGHDLPTFNFHLDSHPFDANCCHHVGKQSLPASAGLCMVNGRLGHCLRIYNDMRFRL